MNPKIFYKVITPILEFDMIENYRKEKLEFNCKIKLFVDLYL